MLRLCITTMNRPDELVACVNSALNSSRSPDEIVVLDNSREHYAQEKVGYMPRVTVLTMPKNIGLGPAWNLFFALYEDLLVFSNDDVELRFDTLELMERGFASGAALLFAETDPWSFFVLRKQAYLDTGPFDPAFWPIYWEDVDYQRRLALNGYHPLTVPGAKIDHVGSATLRAYDQAGRARHDERFLRNQTLYERKWGGPRDQERFTLPYDGRPANIPSLIDKEP